MLSIVHFLSHTLAVFISLLSVHRSTRDYLVAVIRNDTIQQLIDLMNFNRIVSCQ